LARVASQSGRHTAAAGGCGVGTGLIFLTTKVCLTRRREEKRNAPSPSKGRLGWG
jgi:hypothetical protein